MTELIRQQKKEAINKLNKELEELKLAKDLMVLHMM